MSQTFIMNAGNVVLVLAFLASLTFVVRYWIRTRWEDSPVGRQFMYTKIMFVVVLGLGVLGVFLGTNWDGRPYLRVLVYTWVSLAMIRWNIIFSNARKDRSRMLQRAERKAEKDV